MKEEELHNELSSIRSMMERSSKFISLSGLSGILAGLYALAGSAVAYKILYPQMPRDYSITVLGQSRNYNLEVILLIASIVFIASICTGTILTINKAKKKNQPIWGNTSRTLLINMLFPLLTGGLIILILLSRGIYNIVAPLSLIFYGLSLTNASNFTYKDVRYLGLCEIILGLICACLPNYGLLFWAIGFGVLHIIYGSIMYLKYDR